MEATMADDRKLSLRERARKGLLPRLEYRWDVWLSRVSEGDHPSDTELAHMLRLHWASAPADAREYVAGRIDGAIRRPAHRPSKDPLNHWMRAASLTVEVKSLQAAFGLQGKPQPRDLAIARVAERNNLATSTLRDLLKKGLRGSLYRGLSSERVTLEMKEWVAELVEKGVVQLDATEGLKACDSEPSTDEEPPERLVDVDSTAERDGKMRATLLDLLEEGLSLVDLEAGVRQLLEKGKRAGRP
jgi:hypothetical protein